jgi:3-oxoacyl-[acyl-carrier protein] reductase
VAGKAADPEHRAAVIETALSTYGSVDLLVNNTGINPIYGSLLDVDSAVAAKMVDTNVLAAIAWVKACRDAWMGEHGGAVVNLSSVAGLAPSPGIGWYGATKAMLSRVTTELAVELAPTIRINAVAPAVVKTKFAGALYEGREAEVAATYPMKRLGRPEDVGSLVWFLLSDEASWITGQTITIDGGLTLNGGMVQ